MPPPPPFASSTDSHVSTHAITRHTISPVTENTDKIHPVLLSHHREKHPRFLQNSQPPVAMEPKLDDSKLKTYTRDFLMSLKEANLSQVKPDVLDTAILREITYSGRALPSLSVGKKDFNPDYYKPNSSPRGSVGNRRSSISRDNKSMDATAGGRQQHKIKFIREEMKQKSAEETFSSGQITTPMAGFPQQYYVIPPNGSAGISGAGHPNITMSSSFNGTMRQSQMQPPAQATPYPSQQLQQSSTRMSSTATVPIVQPVQQPIAAYGKQERKRNVIPVVDPATKAIVNKDAMATNMTPTNKGTSPASSNSSTPQPAPVEFDQGVRVEHNHFSENVESQPSQASAVSDISAQFKAQVAHVASLFSASVPVVSKSTPPVKASKLRNGWAEPTTSHPEKEASVEGGAVNSLALSVSGQLTPSASASTGNSNIATVAMGASQNTIIREQVISDKSKEQQQNRDVQNETVSVDPSALSAVDSDIGDEKKMRMHQTCNESSKYKNVLIDIGASNYSTQDPIPSPTELMSPTDEYLHNADCKVSTKRESTPMTQSGSSMKRLLLLAHPWHTDGEGNTALHYSAYMNQPDMMKLLLGRGAKVDAVDVGGCSPLHVAVKSQHIDCVKVLIGHDCDVNIQDNYGGTALHDAIGMENTEIVELLIDQTSTNFSLKNKRGFSAFHHAALKGNVYATKGILSKVPTMVDSKKDDGFSSLHIASLNGHGSVVQVLLKQGNADIDLKNNKQQTPLMLACVQGYKAVVEMLVNSGANVTIEDDAGHTALHHVFTRHHKDYLTSLNPGIVDQATLSALQEETAQESAAIAKVLADHNADVLQLDLNCQTPLDFVSDPSFRTELKKYGIFAPCIVCDDQEARVVFQPCRHRIACLDCGWKMKKCLQCKVAIKRKVQGGTELALQPPSYQEVQELNKKLQEMEDNQTCEICLDRRRDTVFSCGHIVCKECAQSLKVCHKCRKPVTQRIHIFLS